MGKKRHLRRTAMVLGLFGIFEGLDAALGVLSRRFPNSGLSNFQALKRGG